MPVNLSSTSSLSDYLSTQGKDASFAARKKLYNEMGLNSRLGDYIGSSNQNINFLNALKTPTTPSFPVSQELFKSTLGESLGMTKVPTGTETVNVASNPPPPAATTAVNTASTPVTPPVTTPQPITATDALNTFGYTPPTPMTAEEVTAKAQATPEYQLGQESQSHSNLIDIANAEAKKQGFESKYESDKQTAIDTLTNKGLASSGFMIEALDGLASELASSKFGVDRELAATLLKSNDTANQKFLDIAADVIKDADAGNKTALEQLNKLGYAYIDGKVLKIPQKVDYSSLKSVQGGLYDVATGQWVVAPKPGGNDLTNYQRTQTFLTVSNKYQADQIINQAVNGQTAVQIADQVIANPEKATSQLASLYLLVKNLDPTSAVREGELALANQTQSYLQKFQSSLTRLSEGRVIAPDAAKALAQATKDLAIAWNNTAARRQEQYQAQADTAGVGNEFSNYLGGYRSEFTSGTGDILTSPDGTQEVSISDLTPSEIQEAKDAGWQ